MIPSPSDLLIPNIVVSDDSWAAEYLETDKNVIDWSAEYLQENTASLSGPDPLLLADHTLSLRGPLLPPENPVALRAGDPVLDGDDGDQLWAEQYLTDVPALSVSDSEPLTASQQIGQSPLHLHLHSVDYSNILSLGKE